MTYCRSILSKATCVQAKNFNHTDNIQQPRADSLANTMVTFICSYVLKAHLCKFIHHMIGALNTNVKTYRSYTKGTLKYGQDTVGGADAITSAIISTTPIDNTISDPGIFQIRPGLIYHCLQYISIQVYLVMQYYGYSAIHIIKYAKYIMISTQSIHTMVRLLVK